MSFLAGTDVRLHNVGLWLLSWPVRWGWLESASALTNLLVRLHGWSRWTSSLRSAFAVRLVGTAGSRRIERIWTLIAERGQGPEIPSLAASILLERLERLSPGARDAGAELTIEDFEAVLAQLPASWETRERELPPPAYARVMGKDFELLAPSVRAFHQVLGDAGAAGRASVRRGRNPVGRLIAAIFRFPPNGEHPLHVTVTEHAGREIWTRDFGGHRMESILAERRGLLVERFGLLLFGFDLPLHDAGGLSMEMRGWWLGPLRLPLAIAPRAPAREWADDGRFCFDVAIALPLIGLVVAYQGWLEVDSVARETAVA